MVSFLFERSKGARNPPSVCPAKSEVIGLGQLTRATHEDWWSVYAIQMVVV